MSKTCYDPFTRFLSGFEKAFYLWKIMCI